MSDETKPDLKLMPTRATPRWVPVERMDYEVTFGGLVIVFEGRECFIPLRRMERRQAGIARKNAEMRAETQKLIRDHDRAWRRAREECRRERAVLMNEE